MRHPNFALELSKMWRLSCKLGRIRLKIYFTPVLIGTLQDASSEVRFWSAFALGQLGDARAIPALEQLAMRDKTAVANWGTVREEALDAITQIHEVNIGVGVC